MIKAIKECNQPREIKEQALTYVRGIVGDIVRKQKAKEQKQSGLNPVNGTPQPPRGSLSGLVGDPATTRPQVASYPSPQTHPAQDSHRVTYQHPTPSQPSYLPLRHSPPAQNSQHHQGHHTYFQPPPTEQTGPQRGPFHSNQPRPHSQSHKHRQKPHPQPQPPHVSHSLSQYPLGQPSEPTLYTTEDTSALGLPSQLPSGDEARRLARRREKEIAMEAVREGQRKPKLG